MNLNPRSASYRVPHVILALIVKIVEIIPQHGAPYIVILLTTMMMMIMTIIIVCTI